MAGIVAANTDNNTGIAGIDWNAQIIDQTWGDDQQTANAIMDAVNSGAHITNNSYAHCEAGTCFDPIPEPRYSATVRLALANAYKMNVVSTAAMGNYNTNDIYYPAGYGQGIIAVGATNRDDTRWDESIVDGSNTGNHIDVVAPGVDVPSTNGNGGYAIVTGTSHATPHVSGIAGLLLAENPNLYNDDIEQIIRMSADDVNAATNPGFDNNMGMGRVNAHQALQLLQGPYVLDHSTTSGGFINSSTGTYTKTFLGVSGLADGVYTVKRHEVRQDVNFSWKDEVQVWCRGVATDGFSAANPNFGMGWCEPVSVDNDYAMLRTYVYEVWTSGGQWVGWYPTSSSNVEFAYSVHGIPTDPPLSVYISGLDTYSEGSNGYWEAEISGGQGPFYSTTWYRSYHEPGGTPIGRRWAAGAPTARRLPTTCICGRG